MTPLFQTKKHSYVFVINVQHFIRCLPIEFLSGGYGMENVEAINRLDALRRENPMLLCADVKAIDMAISALEKLEEVTNNDER